MQPEDVSIEPKTLLDTSVDRRNYGIFIWGTRNVRYPTQLWDLGLSDVLCTVIASSSVISNVIWSLEKYFVFWRCSFTQSKLSYIWLIKQPHSNPRRTCANCQFFSREYMVFVSLVRDWLLRYFSKIIWKVLKAFCVVGKWFEPRGISYTFGVIIRVRVVFWKTVVDDWRFDYLSGSHLQSQVKSRPQMMVLLRKTFSIFIIQLLLIIFKDYLSDYLLWFINNY